MAEVETWRMVVRCTRAEADALPTALTMFADVTPPPVLVASEIDPRFPDRWRIDAYFVGEPPRERAATADAAPGSFGETLRLVWADRAAGFAGTGGMPARRA